MRQTMLQPRRVGRAIVKLTALKTGALTGARTGPLTGPGDARAHTGPPAVHTAQPVHQPPALCTTPRAATPIRLQMVAVRDIGQISAAFLLGAAEAPGGAIEIAGDERTGSQIAAAFGEHAGLPARYEALPLPVLGDDADTQAMFRWFAETPAYQADIRAAKAIEPSAWDLPTWLRSTGWMPDPGPVTTAVVAVRRSLTSHGAAVSAALDWVTQISALVYPGARAVDPPDAATFPQAVIALPSTAGALGWGWLRRQRSRELVGAVSSRTV